MRNSSWTGRAPRTTQQAFGPYTSRHVYDPRPTPRWHRWAYGVVCIAACVWIGVILVIGSRA
jgi:hypothetical protein